VVTLAAKLALVEYFLATDDLSSCAQHGLEWLGTHTGFARAVCAASGFDPRRLWGIAGLGLSAARVGEFSLDLDDRAHPLTHVVERGEATFFPAGTQQPVTPFDGASFYAVPICAPQVPREAIVGVLLIETEREEFDKDVHWFAEVLCAKMTRVRTHADSTDHGLDRERRLLYSIINAVTDPILLTDASGKLIVGNKHAEQLFAASEEQSEGRRRAVAMNNIFFSSALASAAMDQTGRSRELVLVDPEDGSDLLFELLTMPVRDVRDSTAIVSVLRNVTDLGRARHELEENYRRLRLAETEVRAERNRLDLIVDSVVDPIILSDPTGDILMTNAPADRFFTLPLEANADAQRRVNANEAHFSSFVSSLMVSGEDSRWLGRIALAEPATGRTVPMEAVAGKMLTDQSELTAVVTVLHDQTEAFERERLYGELKRASDELEVKVRHATGELALQNELLRRQALELEQASAAKSQFLANMSHEFRTPLNAILGYTSMLLNGAYGEIADNQRRVLTRVDANSRHLLALINDILDISRIEAGRMPLQLSTFHADDLVREVREELDGVIARSPADVRFALAPRVPPLKSDRQKVKQILVNLLSNALKFTPQGYIEVRTAYERRAGEMTIWVRDTGIGIAPADHEKIFEDFRQVDNSPTRAYGGTGLGLSICRRLAEMLGGRMALESTLGEGSTFALILPVRSRGRKGSADPETSRRTPPARDAMATRAGA